MPEDMPEDIPKICLRYADDIRLKFTFFPNLIDLSLPVLGICLKPQHYIVLWPTFHPFLLMNQAVINS